MQKNRAEFADVIMMPYNYLVDARIRDNYKIKFENSIIIIDEAHNIERVAEDVASFDLNLICFNSIMTELEMLVKGLKNHKSKNLDDAGPKCMIEHAESV